MRVPKILKETVLVSAISTGVFTAQQHYLGSAYDIINFHEKNKQEDFSSKVSSLVDSNRLSSARLLLPYVGDKTKRGVYSKTIDEKEGSLSYNLDSVVSGIKGNPNGSALSNGVDIATMFTPIGDARDLLGEYDKSTRGDKVDKMIVSFSAIGLAATILPAMKGTIGIVKKFHKAEKVPSWFIKMVTDKPELSFLKGSSNFDEVLEKVKNIDLKLFKSELKVIEDIGVLVKHTDVETAGLIFKYSDDIASLSKVSKFASLNPQLTKTFLVSPDRGKEFLKAYNRYGDTLSPSDYNKVFKMKGGFKSLNKIGPDILKKPEIYSIGTKATRFVKEAFGVSLDIITTLISLITTLGTAVIYSSYKVASFLSRRFQNKKVD